MNNIRTYFLILGKSCNLQCIYCHQGEDKPVFSSFREKDLPEPSVVTEYFPVEGNYRIVLYGGEPMLYWDFLVSFVELMKERNPNVDFNMPTNGTLLTVEKAKKINELGIKVGLSHDGKYFEQTRKTKDILWINPEPYLTLEKRNISAVVSRINPDFYDVWNYFEEFRIRHGLSEKECVHIQVVKDVEGNTPNELLINNMPEFEQMLDKVFNNLYGDILLDKYDGYEFMQYAPLLRTLNCRLKNPDEKGVWCGADTQVCHIDVYGNMYPCHNSSRIIGNRKNMGIRTGGYNPNLNNEKCVNCHAYTICGGGCPMASPENRESTCYTMYQQITRLLNMLEKLKG